MNKKYKYFYLAFTIFYFIEISSNYKHVSINPFISKKKNKNNYDIKINFNKIVQGVIKLDSKKIIDFYLKNNLLDLNYKDSDNNCLLIIALKKKSYKIAKFLIKKGIDINNTNKKKECPLNLLILSKNNELFKYLLNNNNIELNKTDKNGFLPTSLAVYLGDLEKLKLLIEKNPQSIEENYKNLTPLLIAVLLGFNNIIDYLIDKGANVNATNQYGMSALYLSLGKNEISKRLLQSSNININNRDDSLNTFLMSCIERDYIDIAIMLIQKGADIYLNNINNDNAFTIAIKKNNDFIANILLNIDKEYFINYIYYNCGISIIDYICQKKCEDIIILLIKYLNEYYKQLIFLKSAFFGCIKVIDFIILNKLVDINTKDNFSNNALIIAAYNNHYEIISILIQFGGIYLYQKNDDKKDALDIAISRNNIESINILRNYIKK